MGLNTAKPRIIPDYSGIACQTAFGYLIPAIEHKCASVGSSCTIFCSLHHPWKGQANGPVPSIAWLRISLTLSMATTCSASVAIGKPFAMFRTIHCLNMRGSSVFYQKYYVSPHAYVDKIKVRTYGSTICIGLCCILMGIQHRQ